MMTKKIYEAKGDQRFAALPQNLGGSGVIDGTAAAKMNLLTKDDSSFLKSGTNGKIPGTSAIATTIVVSPLKSGPHLIGVAQDYIVPGVENLTITSIPAEVTVTYSSGNVFRATSTSSGQKNLVINGATVSLFFDAVKISPVLKNSGESNYVLVGNSALLIADIAVTGTNDVASLEWSVIVDSQETIATTGSSFVLPVSSGKTFLVKCRFVNTDATKSDWSNVVSIYGYADETYLEATVTLNQESIISENKLITVAKNFDNITISNINTGLATATVSKTSDFKTIGLNLQLGSGGDVIFGISRDSVAAGVTGLNPVMASSLAVINVDDSDVVMQKLPEVVENGIIYKVNPKTLRVSPGGRYLTVGLSERGGFAVYRKVDKSTYVTHAVSVDDKSLVTRCDTSIDGTKVITVRDTGQVDPLKATVFTLDGGTITASETLSFAEVYDCFFTSQTNVAVLAKGTLTGTEQVLEFYNVVTKSSFGRLRHVEGSTYPKPLDYGISVSLNRDFFSAPYIGSAVAVRLVKSSDGTVSGFGLVGRTLGDLRTPVSTTPGWKVSFDSVSQRMLVNSGRFSLGYGSVHSLIEIPSAVEGNVLLPYKWVSSNHSTLLASYPLMTYTECVPGQYSSQAASPEYYIDLILAGKTSTVSVNFSAQVRRASDDAVMTSLTGAMITDGVSLARIRSYASPNGECIILEGGYRPAGPVYGVKYIIGHVVTDGQSTLALEYGPADYSPAAYSYSGKPCFIGTGDYVFTHDNVLAGAKNVTLRVLKRNKTTRKWTSVASLAVTASGPSAAGLNNFTSHTVQKSDGTYTVAAIEVWSTSDPSVLRLFSFNPTSNVITLLRTLDMKKYFPTEGAFYCAMSADGKYLLIRSNSASSSYLILDTSVNTSVPVDIKAYYNSKYYTGTITSSVPAIIFDPSDSSKFAFICVDATSGSQNVEFGVTSRPKIRVNYFKMENELPVLKEERKILIYPYEVTGTLGILAPVMRSGKPGEISIPFSINQGVYMTADVKIY